MAAENQTFYLDLVYGEFRSSIVFLDGLGEAFDKAGQALVWKRDLDLWNEDFYSIAWAVELKLKTNMKARCFIVFFVEEQD